MRSCAEWKTSGGRREQEQESYTGQSDSLVIDFPSKASLVAQTVKNLPAVQETWIRSLGREGHPGEGIGNPLVFLPGELPQELLLSSKLFCS